MALLKDEAFALSGNKRRQLSDAAEDLTRLGHSVLVVKRGDEKRLAHLIKGCEFVFCDEPVEYLDAPIRHTA